MRKMQENTTYICTFHIFVVPLQRILIDKSMAAVRERVGRPVSYEPILGNYESEVYYTREEYMNELAKQLGQAYGLNDIREAC